MPRLFTGLEIPPDIGRTLSDLRGGLPGARWIDPENYHLTLRFIGDIDGASANEIASVLPRINRKPFDVTLRGLSSFGGKKPRAVVASVEPSGPLVELQAELERLMRRCGLESRGPQVHAPRHAGTLARCIQPRRRELSVGARLFSVQGIHRRRASCCSPRVPRSAAALTLSRTPTRSARDSADLQRLSTEFTTCISLRSGIAKPTDAFGVTHIVPGSLSGPRHVRRDRGRRRASAGGGSSCRAG